MSQTLNTSIAVVGIDIGKNSFHLVGQDNPQFPQTRAEGRRGRTIFRAQVLGIAPGRVSQFS
jgi:hypothetical protein